MMLTSMEETKAAFRRYHDTCLRLLTTIPEVERSDSENAVYNFYEARNLPKPEIVYLPSPWALFQTPKLTFECGDGPFEMDDLAIETVNRSRIWLQTLKANQHAGDFDFDSWHGPENQIVVARDLVRIGARQLQHEHSVDDICLVSELKKFLEAFTAENPHIKTDLEPFDRSRESETNGLPEPGYMLLLNLAKSKVQAIEEKAEHNPKDVADYNRLQRLIKMADWTRTEEFRRRSQTDHVYGHKYGVWTRLNSRQVPLKSYYSDVNWGPWQLLSQVLAPIFCKEVLEVNFGDELGQTITSLSALAKNVHAYLFFENIAFISEFPREIHTDNDGRYHNETGPCVRYADGFALHAWHGTFVTPQIILEEPTVLSIEQEWNAEVRRVMIAKYGEARYLIDSGATPVDESEFGILYRKDINDDEPLTLIKVTNRTAEPDGSYRNYFLRVPPHMRTAKEAVAWTFNMTEDDYEPKVES